MRKGKEEKKKNYIFLAKGCHTGARGRPASAAPPRERRRSGGWRRSGAGAPAELAPRSSGSPGAQSLFLPPGD